MKTTTSFGFLVIGLCIIASGAHAASNHALIAKYVGDSAFFRRQEPVASSFAPPPSREQLERIALQFVAANRKLLQVAEPGVTFTVASMSTHGSGYSHVRLQQECHGVRVYGGEIRIKMAGEEVVFVRSKISKNLPSIVSFQVSERDAESKAIDAVHEASPSAQRLMVRSIENFILAEFVFDGVQIPDSRLAWKVVVTERRRPSRITKEVFVDAASGEVFLMLDGFRMDVPINRLIWDCSFSSPDQGYLDNECWDYLPVNDGVGPQPEDPTDSTYAYTYGRTEAEGPRGPNPRWAFPLFTAPWSINDSDDLFTLIGFVDDYLMREYQMDGANNQGGLAVPYAPWGVDATQTNGFTFLETEDVAEPYGYAAFELTAGDLWFGVGMVVPDVVGHEYAHGILHHDALAGGYSTGTLYWGQVGALEESFADVFGEAVENHIVGNADWHIGTNGSTVWHDSVRGVVRDLSDPPSLSYYLDGTYTAYPSRFLDPGFYCGTGNRAGVHANSTVPSHAFYLIANGGQFSGCTIAPQGLEVAARIYFTAWMEYFSHTETFNEAYESILMAAADLYSPEVVDQVRIALQAVEMDQPGRCSGIPAQTPACAYVAGVVDSPGDTRSTVYSASPNPSPDHVSLQYRLGASGNVRVAVYDIRGYLVAEPLSVWQDLGEQQVVWDGRTQGEERVAPGVYFLRVTVNGRDIGTRRVMVLH